MKKKINIYNGTKMNFIIVFGPLAVGKMTVGQELEKITDLKLFHNHMTIEMVLPYFDMKSASFKKLVKAFRLQILQEVAKSNLAGLIFTYVWELDSKNDSKFIKTIVDIFEQEGATVSFVELEADVSIRLERKKSFNRLKCKVSKCNFEDSEQELLATDKEHIFNTHNNNFIINNHIKINNSQLSAVKTAQLIKERFNLKKLATALPSKNELRA